MATYYDARSARPNHDASSSGSAGSSYVPLPRQSDLGPPEGSGYQPSNVGASGSGGGGGYSSAQFNTYPSPHSQQQRLPHLPPPLQHQQHQQSSYSSHPSHPPHPHSVYHNPHTQRPSPPLPSPSMSYGNYDYSQSLPVFPRGYPGFGLNTSGRGQGNNDVNGGGAGAQASRHAHHVSTNSSGRSEDFKTAYPYFGSTSNATGQSNSSRGGAQRNGGEDEWNPVNVPPLPPHVEAHIFAGSTVWPFESVELNQGSDHGGGGEGIAESSTGAEHTQPSDSGTGQPSSSPPILTQTMPQPLPSAQNNADPSPVDSHPTLPDLSEFGVAPPSSAAIYTPLPVTLPSQMAPPTDPLLLGQPQDSWSLMVEPGTFLSGLEGISALPLQQFHATAASTTGLPLPPMDFNLRHSGNLSWEEEVQLLTRYLKEVITYLEPFAMTRENPTPTHPPPFLHTRVLRLAVIVRNGLRDLEKRSQPCLEGTFRHTPPGIEQTEADKEMAAIRDRRSDLMRKQNDKKNNGVPGPNRPLPPRPLVNMSPSAPRPYVHQRPRDVFRCSGCNTTQSLEWLTGPDGPQSLCHSCGHQYEVLNHARQGDPDFSSIPVPGHTGHNSNLIGLGPN